ncbi:MAG: WD40 repeat domain-containing protein [Myxococcales bacterium]|nr:WD40 repeat domain-containing protein [Myxococcales bacterium]
MNKAVLTALYSSLAALAAHAAGCKKDGPPIESAGESTAPSAPSPVPVRFEAVRSIVVPTGEVTGALALSPDGALLVVGTSDGLVHLVATDGKAPITTLSGHSEATFEAAFSADGNVLATAGADNRLLIWDVPTRKLLRDIAAHDGDVKALAVSPDGKHVATGSVDDDVRVWSTATGKRTHTFKGHTMSVYTLLFATDGKSLYSGARDATVRRWSLENGETLGTSPKLPNSVIALAHVQARTLPELEEVPGDDGDDDGNSDGGDGAGDVGDAPAEAPEAPAELSSYVLAVGLGGQVSWLAPDSLKELAMREIGTSRLVDVVPLPDGSLVIGEQDGRVGVYPRDPTADGVVAEPTQLGKGPIEGLRIAPDGKTLYIATAQGVTAVSPTRPTEAAGSLLPTLPRPGGGVWAMATAGSATKERIAVVSRGRVALTEAPTWSMRVLPPFGVDASVVALSPDGSRVYVGLENGAVFDAGDFEGTELASTGGAVPEDRPAIKNHYREVRGLVTAAGAKGPVLVSAGRDSRIALVDPARLLPTPKDAPDADAQSRENLSEHSSPVVSLAVDSKGTRIASAERDDVAVVRSLENGHILWTRLGREILGMAFSPDGKSLGFIENDRSIEIVNLHAYREGVTEEEKKGRNRSFSGSTVDLVDFAFHPTLPVALTLDELGELRAWSLTDGTSQAVTPAGKANPCCVRALPSGLIATGALDPSGSLKLWRLSP